MKQPAITMLVAAALVLVALVLALVPGEKPVYADAETKIHVIVHCDNPTAAGALTAADIKAMFLKQTAKWTAFAEEVTPIQLESTAKETEVFRSQVLAMSDKDLAKYWADKSANEGINQPSSRKDSAGVYRFVTGKKGAIGYISQSYYDGLVPADQQKVKVLSTFTGK